MWPGEDKARGSLKPFSDRPHRLDAMRTEPQLLRKAELFEVVLGWAFPPKIKQDRDWQITGKGVRRCGRLFISHVEYTVQSCISNLELSRQVSL